MMQTKQEGNMKGRDAEVCGDPKIWFPMSRAIAIVPVVWLKEIDDVYNDMYPQNEWEMQNRKK